MNARMIPLLVILICSKLFAAVINIPEDQATIQLGINAAVDSDTILVQPNTYFENINFNGKDITVASLFLTTQDTTFISQTIIDGNQNGSVITFNNQENSTAILCGFTIINGNGSEENWGDEWDPYYVWLGGGIYIDNASPQLNNLVIGNNSAQSCGGGIYMINSSSNMNELIISNNYSSLGGGFSIHNSSNILSNINIIGNTADSSGGGIYCNNSEVHFNNVTISENEGTGSYSSGGGMKIDNSTITLEGTTIINNHATRFGGGIYNDDSEVIFNSTNMCNIYSNTTEWAISKDIYSNVFIEVVVDTFTVMSPSSLYASPIDNFTFDITNSIETLVSSDLYVSESGNNSNSGTSLEEPLRSIHYALTHIQADSLNPRIIHIASGEYSYYEQFPLIGVSYVTLEGSGSNSTILNGNGQASVIESHYVNNFSLHSLQITNGSSMYGGGIYSQYSSLDLQNVIIQNNYSGEDNLGGDGAGLYCIVSEINISNTSIMYNEANRGAGGIYSSRSDIYMENVIIDNNTAHSGNGGGILISNTTNSYFHNVTISNNFACNSMIAKGGGLVCSSNGSPRLENVIISGNSVDSEHFSGWGEGGGMHCYRSNPTLINVEIFDNSTSGSSGKGSGIFVEDCEPLLVDTLIKNNFGSQGGGIACYEGGNPIIINTTCVNNNSQDGGGIFISRWSHPIIINSILFDNSPQEIHLSWNNPSLSISYSDVQGGESDVFIHEEATLNWLEGNIDENPLFIGYGDNSYTLLDNSPCVNNGVQDTISLNLPELDLAGNPRIFGGRIDIGTYENQNIFVDTDNYTIPIVTKLNQNYPNPFNPTTTIQFSIQNNSEVEISIYNIKGQKIKTLIKSEVTKGKHSLIWNSDNDNGRSVSSGVYLYKLYVNGKTKAVKKCLLLK